MVLVRVTNQIQVTSYLLVTLLKIMAYKSDSKYKGSFAKVKKVTKKFKGVKSSPSKSEKKKLDELKIRSRGKARGIAVSRIAKTTKSR